MSYVPPSYTPIDQNESDQPPQNNNYTGDSQYPQDQFQHHSTPQQHTYPQYAIAQYPPPPQYSHQDQYGYAPQPAAVVVGVTEDDGTPKFRHAEQFSEQLSKLPRRMWLAISRPSVGNYNELKGHASIEITFFILMIIILWSVVLELIGFGITGAHGVGFAILAAIFGTLIFFFLGNLLFHGVALCLGGGERSGSSLMFIRLCFLTLLFTFPLDLLGIFSFIPYIGGVIALIIAIYKIVLIVITLRAIYSIQTCHAIGILVLYVIILLIIILCFFFLDSHSYGLALLRAV